MMTLDNDLETQLENEIRRRLTAGEPTLFRELAGMYGFGPATVQNRIQRVKARLEAEETAVLPALIGQEVVADTLGVTSQAISNWFARELDGMPEPTLIEFKPGKNPQKVWKRTQLKEWRRWHADHLAEQGDHIPRKQRGAQ